MKAKNLAKNQIVISDLTRRTFVSYGVAIAQIVMGKVHLDSRYWNYSKTTAKYRNEFLRETTKETQSKIDSGEYILTDLN